MRCSLSVGLVLSCLVAALAVVAIPLLRPGAHRPFRDGDRGGRAALVIVDMQIDFLPGGSLELPNADALVPRINALRKAVPFDTVVGCRDWHPPRHVSFASSHGRDVLSVVQLRYTPAGQLCDGTAGCQAGSGGGHTCEVPHGNSSTCADAACDSHVLDQTLWPSHCVARTPGAEYHPGLDIRESDIHIKKGTKCHVDSYSAFADNGGFATTPLEDELLKAGIRTIFTVGVAREICIQGTAMDGAKRGFNVVVVEDATQGITEEGVSKAQETCQVNGIATASIAAVTDAVAVHGNDWDAVFAALRAQ